MNTRFIFTAFTMTMALATSATLAAPATQPALDAATIARGRKVRTILVETIEQTYQNRGAWPARLEIPPDGPKLVYKRPTKITDSEAFSHIASAVVVLHESLKDFPDGVWVGYADGHLEFAPDARTLADCEAQRAIAVNAAAIRKKYFADSDRRRAATEPAAATGQLTIKLIDPQGRPVSGARVGLFETFDAADAKSPAIQISSQSSRSLVSDSNGRIVLNASDLFNYEFYYNPSVPLIVFDAKRELTAIEQLKRSAFGHGLTHEIHLQPACQVTGNLTTIGLHEPAGALRHTFAYAYFAGGFYQINTVLSNFDGMNFNLRLPPGDFKFEVYGINTKIINRFAHIAPGQRNLKLQIDLPPTRVAELVGQPAPELRKIKGWENGGPVTLADLRGKVVLLDFWGYWCAPCLRGLAPLTKLYNEFHSKGLVVIAVHDDSVASIAEMDRKMAETHAEWATDPQEKKYIWGKLPFLIALDGGGRTRMYGTASTARGATTAAYGVFMFPTSVLIGRDGKVLEHLSVHDFRAADGVYPGARADIAKALKVSPVNK